MVVGKKITVRILIFVRLASLGMARYENTTVRILIFVRLASLGERSASDTGLGWYDMKTLTNSPLKLLWDHPLADKN